jgi:pyruvate/2-oxoglutarate dehydrogenase complex dihydrolipoamide acyltransferase (E2) component
VHAFVATSVAFGYPRYLCVQGKETNEEPAAAGVTEGEGSPKANSSAQGETREEGSKAGSALNPHGKEMATASADDLLADYVIDSDDFATEDSDTDAQAKRDVAKRTKEAQRIGRKKKKAAAKMEADAKAESVRREDRISAKACKELHVVPARLLVQPNCVFQYYAML